MAQRKPQRKGRLYQRKREKNHPLDRSVSNRIVRRAVVRRKKKQGYQEWKAVSYVIAGMILAVALLIILYCLTHEAP